MVGLKSDSEKIWVDILKKLLFQISGAPYTFLAYTYAYESEN